MLIRMDQAFRAQVAEESEAQRKARESESKSKRKR